MTLKKWLHAGVAVSLLGGLAACGGGGGGESLGETFTQNYGTALAATTTPAGVNSVALKDSFDEKFLDAGYTKAQVVANLDQDAQAMATPEYSLFPQLALSDASVGSCGSDNVCTLTGNLTNTDADTTTVPVSVRVVLTNGGYRLYGDQKAS
jgi:hypothetical protein